MNDNSPLDPQAVRVTVEIGTVRYGLKLPTPISNMTTDQMNRIGNAVTETISSAQDILANFEVEQS